MSETITYVPSRLTSAKPNKVVAGANEILDDDIHLKQNAINALTEKVITLNAAPTSSTLTYTVDGVTCDFAIGDEVRVVDSTQGDAGTNNYIYYKLFDINNGVAYWSLLKSNGESSGEYGYVPTLEDTPTDSTLTYVKDGKTISFVIGQFARVADDSMVTGYRFYQLYDIKDNNTTAVWSEFATKLDPTYTAPTPKSLTYNGNNQSLLNAGSTSDGTIKYSNDGVNWSNNIPTGKSAGNYTIYWKLAGDGIHSDVPPTSITVTIAKASRTISFTQSSSELFVNDTATFIATPSAGSGDGSVTYTSSNTSVATFNGNVLSCISAGNVTVTATIAEGANYLSATTSITVTVNVKGLVDLGLPSGRKWAKGNIVKVGSSYKIGNETDYGTYFSWGNIIGHNEGESYNFNDSTYNGTPGKSLKANIASNDAAHDAALACLGSPWRLPTKEEFQELYNNTDNEWTTINGIKGRKFMKKSDHSVYIFLPTNGLYAGTSISSRGTGSYHWSSSYKDSSYAYHFEFGTNTVVANATQYRRQGMSVRAVQ